MQYNLKVNIYLLQTMILVKDCRLDVPMYLSVCMQNPMSAIQCKIVQHNSLELEIQ